MPAMRLRALALVLVGVPLVAACAVGSEESQESEESIITWTEMGAPPDTATAPGTQLAWGEVARTFVSQDDQSSQFSTAVTRVIEGDESFWQGSDDPEQFAGLTPFFVIIQHEVVVEGEEKAFEGPELHALLEDGSIADSLTTEGDVGTVGEPACPMEMEQPTESTRHLVCLVAAAPDGGRVAGAAWNNQNRFFEDVEPGDNPYAEQPVTWREQP